MKTSLTTADGVLRINALDVTDEVTVTYIDHLAPDVRVAGVLNCLQLGARTLTFASDKTGAALLADTLRSESEKAQSLLTQVSKTAELAVTKSSETMESAIAKLLDDLGKELSGKLDPANTESIIGKLRVALVADCQRVTAKVREDLDMANPQSPLSALRAELEKSDERRHGTLMAQLSELLQRQAAKAAASAERSKSTRKGGDFEAATLDFLTAESRPRKDLVTHTGREHGLDQNCIGDFAVEINPSEAHKLRIVVESKNRQKNNATERVRELDKAMSNRGAEFGISVETSSGETTQAIIPFGDDRLIVRVPALPDEGWDFTALGIALECARWKALMKRTTSGPLDVLRLNAEIERALGITNSFTEVKKRITASKTQLDGIEEYLDDVKRQLVAALHQIRATVVEAQDTPEAA
jgi:hypothetical protein